MTVLLAAVGFILGWFVRSPDASVLELKDSTVPVFAAAEMRSVSGEVRIQGTVVGADPVSILVQPPAGTTRAVVTSITAAAGDELSNGALLGTVSDRPVFVFSVRIPLYRDLSVGTKGSDVASLQAAMGVPSTGTFDTATTRAVRALYAKVGQVPPGGKTTPFVSESEFYTLRADLGVPTVLSTSTPGTELDGTHPLATLGVGTPYVSLRASVVEATDMTDGQAVTIDLADGNSVSGSVSAISAFQATATDGGRPPGRDIRISASDTAKLSPGATVSVLFGEKVPPQLSVPTLAVRSDSSGDYVLTKTRGGKLKRVDITVERNADGWSAVKAQTLSAGDAVLVSE